jgi:5-formaminoimidazole-4-carboxamide-1-(beta)-D-ribofuranosyl 5'-monophosphate synthetase
VTEIATLGSHCALQVLKGAKDEGFPTLLVCQRKRESLYRRFGFIDEYLFVDSFSEVTGKENLSVLKDRHAVIIPHGTLVSEVGAERVLNDFDVPIFGSRKMLLWESDRELKERLMRESGLRTPKAFSSPEDIDRLVIVKLHGARGGQGYFLADSPMSYEENLRNLRKSGKVEMNVPLYIQEYVIGTPVYFEFFHSVLSGELEFHSIDRRYETTVDGFGRVPASMQGSLQPSYVVVGNSPLVLRESLLEQVFKMGEEFVSASARLVPPGMIGPFCIEGVYDENSEFVAFEFSARIVAGTNLYTQGSPYTVFLFDKPMSMGRRIAVEIKEAAETGSLAKVTT